MQSGGVPGSRRTARDRVGTGGLSHRFRTVHRWASLCFVIAVPLLLLNPGALWSGVLGVGALLVLLVTGLQMDARHYLARRRRRGQSRDRSAASLPRDASPAAASEHAVG